MYEELIKRLKNCTSDTVEDCAGCPYQGGYKGTYCMNGLIAEAADAIEELSMKLHGDEAAIAGMKREIERMVVAGKPRWIPVTERLPNCNGCYLVWRPHFFGGEIGMPSICYFDGSNTWHDSYGVDFARILHPEDVTHWMPLPEPPKDGE